MKNMWDKFFEDKIKIIFTEKKNIIDIGGGLRALKGRGNRQSRDREWITPLIKKVNYKILDPVKDYNPDIVGDIHNLPFSDNSCDAIICIAVLEHVENPWKACQEMHRVLKQGGYCFVYVPFLYYYHSHEGYYKDYWRFTKDSLGILFKNFTSMEVENVRGAIATWLRISPLGKYKIIEFFGNFFDKIFGKTKSNQTSGYYIFFKK
ncbi:MAG: Methyltransferase type 11 [Parcubacteria group bacterium GW2011_GWA2_38_13]|nr:MAG: Methyltransferase type 11 [Parcubacteria group bacterium GW2011_GWA2_38_13]